MESKELDKVQDTNLALDVHHIFPPKWCIDIDIDDERRESIVNMTALSAVTNRTIGGAAPSAYLAVVERKAQITPEHLDRLLATHLMPEADLRADDFDAFFAVRREALCQLVEKAMGKAVPRDLDQGAAEEDSSQFELSEIEELSHEKD